MARGFESKSVESQQAEVFERPAEERWSPEEIARRTKRESLEMSRRRVEGELAGARSAVHKTALENALRFLDDELSKL